MRQRLLIDEPVRKPVPLRIAAERQPACGACGYFRTCKSPKLPVVGKGARGILVVGSFPSDSDDRFGRHFAGDEGRLMRDAFHRHGVDMDNDCWATSAIICKPPKGRQADEKKDVLDCQPNLLKTIHTLKPTSILLSGREAIASLIGWLWKEDVGPASRWAGFRIPSERLNAWVCPTFAIDYLRRRAIGKEHHDPAMTLFYQHVGEAVRLSSSVPHPHGAPEVTSKLKLVKSPAVAAALVDALTLAGRPVAFDYETDRAKPDSADARVVCCAVSDGDVSVAYPWHGEAVRATSRLLLSDVPKLGWNMGFEERWTWRALGHGVNNWLCDGMHASHVADNRPGTKSLKFQAFVRLGVDSYDDDIRPYLEAKGGNIRNRIHEVRLDKLLEYCAKDALYEWRLTREIASEIRLEEVFV